MPPPGYRPTARVLYIHDITQLNNRKNTSIKHLNEL